MRAAAKAVTKKGYDAVRLAGILREARMGRNTFYVLFEGKDQCFQSAIEWIGIEAASQVESALQEFSDGGFEDPLRAGLHALISFGAEHLDLTRLYFLHGPTISLEAVEGVRHRFEGMLSSEPGVREELLVGAIEQALYQHFVKGRGGAAPELADSLAELVLSSRMVAV